MISHCERIQIQYHESVCRYFITVQYLWLKPLDYRVLMQHKFSIFRLQFIITLLTCIEYFQIPYTVNTGEWIFNVVNVFCFFATLMATLTGIYLTTVLLCECLCDEFCVSSERMCVYVILCSFIMSTIHSWTESFSLTIISVPCPMFALL